MIDQLVAALGQELGLTSKEIADTVWLALQMDSSELFNTTARNATSGETDIRSSRGQSVNRNALASNFNSELEQSSQEAQPAAELHTPNSQSENGYGLGSELMLKVPDARSLREPLSLAKSLKPLLQKVTAGWSTKLDEAATVERIADEGIWMPVLQPALEPWLDLALVVDESISMHLWQHTLTELQRLLANYGVFRDVRVWGLVTDDGGKVKLRPRLGAAARRQTLHRPSELIDAGGRRLILIATDCVSAIWQNGTVLPALKLWATNGPMAIVQMLPEWLWTRTGLGFASVVRLHSLMPGVPNQQLDVRDLSIWDEVNLETGVRVPVVTLEPEPCLAWAKMVSAKEGAWAPGFIFEPDGAASIDDAQIWDTSSENSAERRVQRFRSTASPMARRLAGLLAAAPVISLPVVRMICDRLLPQSRQMHVAEVFLGGILTPISDVNIDTIPDNICYEFWDGLRDSFLESIPTTDSLMVLEAVSSFVASRLGLSVGSFTALLKHPQSLEERKLAEQSRPFAIITASILRKLGGQYADFAVQLEQVNKYTKIQSKGNRRADWQTLSPQYAEELLYRHLLKYAKQEEPDQLIERFQKLFMDKSLYPDKPIQHALTKLTHKKNDQTEFKYVINRCAYILINRWALKEEQSWAIPELVDLFEFISDTSEAEEERKQVICLSKDFKKTEQYTAIKRLGNLFREGVRDSKKFDFSQPLSMQFYRYFFLYENSILTKDSDQTQKRNMAKLRTEAKYTFRIRLLEYCKATNKHLNFNHLNTTLLSDSELNDAIEYYTEELEGDRSLNPTLLSDSELNDAIRCYAGKVEGDNSHHDIAKTFQAYSRTIKSFRDFKEEFIGYLLFPLVNADSNYLDNNFSRALRQYLRDTLQEFENQPLTDFVVITTCQKLLNFLVVQGRQKPIFRRYWQLLNELGYIHTTELLLRIILFCGMAKPWLESRMGILFNYHSQVPCKDVLWLIYSLEHMNVALTANVVELGH